MLPHLSRALVSSWFNIYFVGMLNHYSIYVFTVETTTVFISRGCKAAGVTDEDHDPEEGTRYNTSEGHFWLFTLLCFFNWNLVYCLSRVHRICATMLTAPIWMSLTLLTVCLNVILLKTYSLILCTFSGLNLQEFCLLVVASLLILLLWQ